MDDLDAATVEDGPAAAAEDTGPAAVATVGGKPHHPVAATAVHETTEQQPVAVDEEKMEAVGKLAPRHVDSVEKGKLVQKLGKLKYNT